MTARHWIRGLLNGGLTLSLGERVARYLLMMRGVALSATSMIVDSPEVASPGWLWLSAPWRERACTGTVTSITAWHKHYYLHITYSVLGNITSLLSVMSSNTTDRENLYKV